MLASDLKTCSKCRELRLVADFPRRTDRPSGLSSACKTCENKRCREYRTVNLERERARDKARPEKSRQYRAKNVAKEQARIQKYYVRNRDRVLKRCSEYAANNLHKKAAWTAKRRGTQAQRTPPWLNQAHVAEIEGQYHFAKVMEQITGQKHHVDHIEPLQGNDVSGLHVPWNLRVIPARENIAKGNRRIEAHG